MKRRTTARGLPGYVGPGTTRVLLEVLAQDRPTIRSIGDALDRSSTRTVQQHLGRLRDLGLVRWSLRRKGTLRPACWPVPFGPDHGPG
jgi:predicted ArsR family transcriptional regulator